MTTFVKSPDFGAARTVCVLAPLFGRRIDSDLIRATETIGRVISAMRSDGTISN